jgi:hypothetical protein
MVFEPLNTDSKSDPTYYHYLEHCERVTTLLDNGINLMITYILAGRTRCPQEWDNLFRALNQASFMREYLNHHCSNLITIAEDFLAQLQEWQDEVQATLN